MHAEKATKKHPFYLRMKQPVCKHVVWFLIWIICMITMILNTTNTTAKQQQQAAVDEKEQSKDYWELISLVICCPKDSLLSSLPRRGKERYFWRSLSSTIYIWFCLCSESQWKKLDHNYKANYKPWKICNSDSW